MSISHHRIGALTELASGKRFSPAELSFAVDRRRQDFAKAGLHPGRLAFIYQNNSVDFFVNLLAIWSAGACAVPLGRHLPAGLRLAFEERFGPLLVIEPDNSVRHRESPAVVEGDAALILMTSGSTGGPKGLRHTFAAIDAKLAALQSAIPAAEVARTLCALPTYFGHGLMCNSLFPLLTGQELYVLDGFSPASVSALNENINAKGITFFSTTPVVWSLISQFSSNEEKPSLARVHCASAPFHQEAGRTMRAWSPRTQFWNVYGLTEFLGWVSGARLTDETPADDVGQAWGVTARVVDDELQLKGPFHAIGLEGWYGTRDRAALGADGHILLKGRLDFLINKGGLKIQPEEIEQLVSNFPGVGGVCCFPVPDRLSGQIVGLAIAPRGRGNFDERALLSWLRERLPAFQVPDRVFLLDALPTTPRGKTDRRAVMELVAKT